MFVNMLDDMKKSDLSYGPSTIYIHEKNVPYPYQHTPEPHHHCEIHTDSYRHMMMPHYIVPLVVLGSVMLFAVVTLGLLVVVDRARLTPVVRARLQDLQNQSSFISVEEILMKAIDVYTQLNSS